MPIWQRRLFALIFSRTKSATLIFLHTVLNIIVVISSLFWHKTRALSQSQNLFSPRFSPAKSDFFLGKSQYFGLVNGWKQCVELSMGFFWLAFCHILLYSSRNHVKMLEKIFTCFHLCFRFQNCYVQCYQWTVFRKTPKVLKKSQSHYSKNDFWIQNGQIYQKLLSEQWRSKKKKSYLW